MLISQLSATGDEKLAKRAAAGRLAGVVGR
jgi:hypothetical protein